MTEVSQEQLVRWYALATLAYSEMSLVYYRGAIQDWTQGATPSRDKWSDTMSKAERVCREIEGLLREAGLKHDALHRSVAGEMDRPAWDWP